MKKWILVLFIIINTGSFAQQIEFVNMDESSLKCDGYTSTHHSVNFIRVDKDENQYVFWKGSKSDRYDYSDINYISKYNKEGVLVFKKPISENTSTGDIFSSDSSFSLVEIEEGGYMQPPRSINLSKYDTSANLLVKTPLKINSWGNVKFGTTGEFYMLTNNYTDLIIGDDSIKKGSLYNDNIDSVISFLVSFNNEGKILWYKSLTKNYASGSMSLDLQGNIIISGWFYVSPLTFYNDYKVEAPTGDKRFMAKFSPKGELIWARRSPSGTNFLFQESQVVFSDGDNGGISAMSNEGDYIWNNYFVNGPTTLNNDDDGNIYCTSVGELYRAYNKNGEMLSIKKLNQVTGTYCTFSKGSLYVGGGFYGNVRFDDAQEFTSGCNSMFFCKINLEQVLNTPELLSDKNEFTLYPNPSSGNVSVTGKLEDARTIQLRDITGRIVLEHHLLSKQVLDEQLDLSNFPKGIYFIELVYGTKKITKKLVLN